MIRENVLRVHVLANSNEKVDQDLKLAVRDRILSELDTIFNNATSKESAKENAQKNITQIEKFAQDEVERQGFDYPVNVEICNMFFDTRVYENFTLPAGRYDAVRITIGQANGENWWCVLYPALCIPSAQPNEELNEKFTTTQAQIVSTPENYQIEFVVVELFEKIREKFSPK